MNNTTTDTDASPTPDQSEEMAKRREMLEKVITRSNQICETIGLIERATKANLIDMVTSHPLGEVVDTFVELSSAIENLSSSVKAISDIVSYVREVTMPERMDTEETKTFTAADSGNRVTRTIRLFASITSDKQDEAYDWLRENGFEALIKETVNSSALSSSVKEMMENGIEPPEELIRVHTKNGISITKGKQKGKK